MVISLGSLSTLQMRFSNLAFLWLLTSARSTDKVREYGYIPEHGYCLVTTACYIASSLSRSGLSIRNFLVLVAAKKLDIAASRIG